MDYQTVLLKNLRPQRALICFDLLSRKRKYTLISKNFKYLIFTCNSFFNFCISYLLQPVSSRHGTPESETALGILIQAVCFQPMTAAPEASFVQIALDVFGRDFELNKYKWID